MKRYRPLFKYLVIGVLLLVLLINRQHPEISTTQGVAGISIDPGKGGEYVFGLELANPDKESGFTVKSETMTIVAADLRQALDKAGLQNEFPVTLTHGSLIVLHADLIGSDMSKISEMLLEQWSGRCQVYMTVADGCRGQDVLRSGEGDNLRAGFLSEQIRRADREGKITTLAALDTASRYLRGEAVSLPLLSVSEESYRISGCISIRKVN